jgi:hypothetical protein
MRKLLAACCLFSASVMAQPVETVSVIGGTLTGVWKVTLPAYSPLFAGVMPSSSQ